MKVEQLERERMVLASHPHLRWLELRHRGYVLLDIDRERTVAEWHHVESIEERSDRTSLAKALATARGRPGLREHEGVTRAIADAPAPAPSEEG